MRKKEKKTSKCFISKHESYECQRKIIMVLECGWAEP